MKNKINERLFRELFNRALFGEATMMFNDQEMIFTHGGTLDVFVVNEDTIDPEGSLPVCDH